MAFPLFYFTNGSLLIAVYAFKPLNQLGCASLAINTTLAPNCAKDKAILYPIPLVPPVTKATLSENSF